MSGRTVVDFHRVLAAVIVTAAGLVAGCSSDEAGKDKDDAIPVTDTMDVRGLIVIHVGTKEGFGLLDPRTGLSGGRYALTDQVAGLRFSPDGRMALYRTTTGFELGRAVIEADGPKLEKTAAIAVNKPMTWGWGSRGDRVWMAGMVEAVWADAAGKVLGRHSGDKPGGGQLWFAASPDGRHYLVSNGHGVQLFNDGKLVWWRPGDLGKIGGVDPGFTPDGQWYIEQGTLRPLHIPTLTAFHDAHGIPTGDERLGLHVFTATGELLTNTSGRHGWVHGATDSYHYQRTRPMRRVALGASIDADKLVTTPGFPTGPRANYRDGKVTNWGTVGISADGTTAFSGMKASTWVTKGRLGTTSKPLFDVSLAITTGGGFDLGNIKLGISKLTGWTAGQSAQTGAKSVLIGSGFAGGAAWDDGWVALPDIGMVLSPDGQHAVGSRNGLPQDDGSVTCIDGTRRPWPRSCMRTPALLTKEGAQVTSWGGFAATNTPKPNKPLLHGISQKAATPGSHVWLFGEGFGATAAVKIGAVEVPASDVKVLDANSIRITTSATLPELGRVVVTQDGTSTASERIFLARTNAWTHTIGAPTSTELVRGTNKLTIPGYDPKKGAIHLLPGKPVWQIFPNPTVLGVQAGATPSAFNVTVPSSWKTGPAWLVIHRDDLARMVAVTVK